MEAVTGTFHDGRIVLDSPVDWPEGARVEVVHSQERIGMTEAMWPTDEEGRRRLSELMISTEAPEMTAAEEEEWLAALKEFGDYTIKKMADDTSFMP